MGRDYIYWQYETVIVISIHSPRMGRDIVALYMMPKRLIFQSTLPAWGETSMPHKFSLIKIISIHSPRMGRDIVY